MLQAYRQHVAERAALGIPPLALDAKQVAELIELIKNPPAGEEAFLLELLTHRVPPGVDDAAKVKASFLSAVAHGDIPVTLISKAKATELLGTMVGGYNVKPLIDLLDDAEVASVAADSLSQMMPGLFGSEQTQNLLNGQRQRMMSQIGSDLDNTLLFVYRDLSDNELNEFVRFAESANGKLYYQAALASLRAGLAVGQSSASLSAQP